MKQLSQKEIDQINASVDQIWQSIRASGQDLDVTLKALRRANERLEASVSNGASVSNVPKTTEAA
jgi:hypothetical protein